MNYYRKVLRIPYTAHIIDNSVMEEIARWSENYETSKYDTTKNTANWSTSRDIMNSQDVHLQLLG